MTASLTKSPPKQQSLLLQDISWSTYQSLVKDIAAQRGFLRSRFVGNYGTIGPSRKL